MVEVSPVANKSKPEANNMERITSMSSRIESLTIQEDVKEGEAEDEEGLPVFPYERLKVNAADPVTEIDVTKREVNHETICSHTGISFLCQHISIVPIAGVSVLNRIQREVRHYKGCFLQVTQVEAEQAQNGPAVVLSLPRLQEFLPLKVETCD